MKRLLIFFFFVCCLGLRAQSPGGVSSNLIFWLKADAGVTTATQGSNVTTWADQTVNGNDATSGGTAPTYEEVLTSYNPAIDFSPTSGFMDIADNASINTSSSTAKSYSIVIQTGSDVTTRQVIYEQGGGTNGMNLYIESGQLHANLWVSNTPNDASTAIAANEAYVITFVYDGGSTRWDTYVNGSLGMSSTSTPASLNSHSGDIGLGGIDGATRFAAGTSGGSGFSGYIMEMAYYNTKVFTAAERNRIETYMAYKYGVEIPADYIASDGTTTYWDLSLDTGFNQDIAGIGRDDNSGLDQKQGKSANSDGLLTWALGNTVASSNVNNASTFSADLVFAAFGNDDGSILSFTQVGAPSGRSILQRGWQYQITGNVGAFTIQIPDNSSSLSTKLPPENTNLYILVDTDSDFSAGATEIAMSLNGTNWEANVSSTGGTGYFTFASLPSTDANLSVTTNGDEDGPVNIEYTVALADINTTGQPIRFHIQDAGSGTASSNFDYTAVGANDSIEVANGALTGTYTLTVTDDQLEEYLETVVLRISNPSDPSTTIGLDSAIATIDDNDQSIPGGVASNLALWLKANRGTNTTINGASVTTWADQSANGNDATPVTTNPVYDEDGSNFNPSVDFSSATGGFTMADASEINNGGPYAAKSYTVAFKTGSDIATRQMIYEQGGGGNGLSIYINGGILEANLWNSNTDYPVSTSSISTNTDYIATYIFDGASTEIRLYLNGSLVSTNSAAPSTLANHGGDIGIGVIDNNTQYNPSTDVGSGESFLGHIMEIIYYNEEVLTATEVTQIESYTAIKYGIGLSTDYIASDGTTTFWDNGANSGYTSHLTGIGLDAVTGLEQKQSKSGASGSLLTIGLPDLVGLNINNTGDFTADKSFMLWGSNNGAVSFTTTGTPIGTAILNRQWKIEETGTVDTVVVQVPSNSSSESTKLPAIVSSSLYLLVDADGDFSSGATAYEMNLVGNNWEIEHDFSDGDYFTFLDGKPELTVTTQGDETGPVNIVVTLTLPYTNSSGSSITYELDDVGTGTATSAFDYTAIPANAQITILNGSQTGTYTVTVIDDNVDENDPETVILTAFNSILNGVGDTISANISDDDVALPAGVSNVALWLRADLNTSTTAEGADVSTWSSLVGSINATSASGDQPSYLSSFQNFNPALDFDAANSEVMAGSSGFYSTAYYVVFNVDDNYTNATDEDVVIGFNVPAGATDNFGGLVLGSATGAFADEIITHAIGGTGTRWRRGISQTAFGTIPADTSLLIGIRDNAGGTSNEMYVNGVERADLSNGTFLTSANVDFEIASYIESNDFETTNFMDGQVSEIISFSTRPNDDAHSRIQSYLALKYGIMLDNTAGGTAGDLLSSNSTVVWDASANSTYHNNVAGIARDDISSLHQKQSSSNEPGTLLTLGIGSIAATNLSNASGIGADLSYLVWGNDQGSLLGVANTAGLTTADGEVDQLQRNWKIVETGSVGSVQLAFPKDSIDSYLSTYLPYTDVYLRVADDASFTTNVSDALLSATLINGEDKYAGNFDFDGTKYFTIVLKGAIIWTGTEWRGGLSGTVTHGPSDDPQEATKNLIIFAGDTAEISEGVLVDSLDIASSADLHINPQNCLTTTKASNSGAFLLKADNTGYAQYKGPAITATFQQYIDSVGWHNIGSPFSDATFDDFTFLNDNGFINHPIGGASLDSCIYCNVWWYDPSADNGEDIGFGSSTAYGTWKTTADSSDAFDGTKGWNIYFDTTSNFTSSPWTVAVSGTLNDGNITQTVNENNNGWNLVANPYPSVINWNDIDDDLNAAGIANAYHIWDHTNSNYSTYSLGSGTLGATQYIAPFQGFFIQTSTTGAQNSGDVFRSFSLSNSDRPNVCSAGSGFFKTNSGEQIVLRSKHTKSGKIDETILKFDVNASNDFYAYEDVNKLFTFHSNVASVYSYFDDHYAVISTLNYPGTEDSVRVGVKSRNGSEISLEVKEFPPGWTIYLEDLKTGIWNTIDQPYVFTQDEEFRNRFVLHFGPGNIERKGPAGDLFEAYVNNGALIINTRSDVYKGNWQLVSLTGAIIRKGNIEPGTGRKHKADVSGIGNGTYVLVLYTDEESHAKKIPILQ